MRYIIAIVLLLVTCVACVGGPSTPATVDREASQVPRPASSPVATATAEPRATPTPEPTPTPKPTATPTPKEAIVAFTQAALRLEGKRDKVVEGLARYSPLVFYALNLDWSAYGMEGEGLWCLLGELALLDAPPQLRPIKDALLAIYSLEVDLLIRQGECTSWEADTWGNSGYIRCAGSDHTVFPRVTEDNVESAIADGESGAQSGWAAAQLLRAKTYERWREVLEDVGIDLTGYPYNLLK